ncbi:major facilitator superfamily domain-containing protein [Ditylenchus destructor]|nr:major facilitator superfamily domain-containing protein [Ditylenchus destructor]
MAVPPCSDSPQPDEHTPVQPADESSGKSVKHFESGESASKVQNDDVHAANDSSSSEGTLVDGETNGIPTVVVKGVISPTSPGVPVNNHMPETQTCAEERDNGTQQEEEKTANGRPGSIMTSLRTLHNSSECAAADDENGQSFSGSLDDEPETTTLPDGDYHSTFSINDLHGEGFRHETLVDHLPIAPDGGYGWVIVAAAFVSNFIIDGISNSFGAFMSSYQESFKATKAATSVIGSLLVGFYLLSGPVAGGLLNKYESRKVVIAGTLLSSSAFLLSTLSPNIYVFYILYGILGGIGFGFIFLPAIVAVSQYFETKRALATGISVSGSGCGTFVMPLLCSYLIPNFGWRITLCVLAVMLLICAFCGTFYKPLPIPEGQVVMSEEMKQQQLLAVLSRAEMDSSHDNDGDDDQRSRLSDGNDEEVGTHVAGGSPFKRNTFRTNSQSTNHPEKEDGQPLLNNAESIAHQMSLPEDCGGDELTPTARVQLSPISEYRPLSKSRAGSQYQHSNANGTAADGKFNVGPRTRKATLTSMNSNFTSIAGGIDMRLSRPNLSSQLSRVSARSYAQSLSRISQSHFNSHLSIKGADSVLSVALSGVDPKEFNRPMSRRDVFLQGSIRNLREFAEEGSNYKAYRESQISIPMSVLSHNVSKTVQSADIADLSSKFGSRYSEIPGGPLIPPELQEILPLEEENKYFRWIPLPIRTAFADMIDLNLLKEPIMLLICFSNMLGMIGFYVPFVFLIDLSLARQSTMPQATFLLSIIGITNTFGRVFFGWVADRQWVTALAINNWSLICCGILTIICPLLPNYQWLCFYAGLFGFIVAAYICLTSIVLSDLLGVERLTNSFGLLVVSRGISSLLGTPLAGIVYDMTSSYDASFYFAGSLILLSGLVSCIIPVVHKRERSKLKNEGDYFPAAKEADNQSGKLSVLTERSEENLTEYQRTIQSLQQQKQLIRELEEYKKLTNGNTKVEEVNEENVDGDMGTTAKNA